MSVEKAIVVYQDDEGHVSERVVIAGPYDTFFSREISALPGPYSRVHCVYGSQELLRVLEKSCRGSGIQGAIDLVGRLRGIGDLSLERAAALYAKLEI